MPLPKSVQCSACKKNYPEGWIRCPYCGFDAIRTKREAAADARLRQKVVEKARAEGRPVPEAFRDPKAKKGQKTGRQRTPQQQQRDPRPQPRDGARANTPRPKQEQQPRGEQPAPKPGQQPATRSRRRGRRGRGGADRGARPEAAAQPNTAAQTPALPQPAPQPREAAGDGASKETGDSKSTRRRRFRRRRRGGGGGPPKGSPPQAT